MPTIPEKNTPKEPRLDAGRSSRPLYRQVRDYIETRIGSGQWPPETRIPSENELVASMGVSRMTVNRALRELAGEGHLHRVQGVGTFVALRKPQAALLKICSIAEEIQSRGGEHTSDVRLLSRETPPRDVAAILGLPARTMAFHAVLVHRDRGLPIQLAERWVNPAVAPDFLNQDFTRLTPSDYLVRVAPVTEVEHVIEAVVADESTRRLLEIAPGEPCLVLHRTVWSGPLVASCNRFVYPGSRYRIGGRFKPTSAIHGFMP
ncbi:MAG: histidine utilization repressor [Desulfobacterales bacterium]|nr:histidine utilization repressor [Desulfobacterales bacterium]